MGEAQQCACEGGGIGGRMGQPTVECSNQHLDYTIEITSLTLQSIALE